MCVCGDLRQIKPRQMTISIPSHERFSQNRIDNGFEKLLLVSEEDGREINAGIPKFIE